MTQTVTSAWGRTVVMAAALMLAGSNVFAQGSADTASVAKARAAFEKAAGAQDAAGLAKLFAADGIEMPPNAPASKGRAAIEAYHKAFAKQFMIHGITLTATDTRVLGDTAIDIGTYTQGLMPQQGGGMYNDTGKYIVLLKKDASGGWLVTHAIYNSDAPPPVLKK